MRLQDKIREKRGVVPRFVCCLALSIFAPASPSPAADPSSKPPPEITALAEKLLRVSDAHEQDEIADKTDPALLNDAALRHALLDFAFQYSLEGNYPKAEKADRLIIHLGEHLHDPAIIAGGQTMAGGVVRESGDYSEGLKLLREAAAYYDRQKGPTVEKMSVSQALGITYLYEGNFRRALANLERSLKIANELHETAGIIPALNSIGEVLRTQGQPERALEFYERARKTVGDDSAWNMAFIFNNIGMAYEAMGETQKAIENLNRARAVAEKVKFQPRVASALTELGNLHLRAGELDAARKCFDQSMELSVQLHDRSNEARAHVGLARVARARKDLGAALEETRHALEIYRALQEHDSIARVQTIAGECLYSLGKNEQAHTAFKEAVAEIEQVRGELAGGAEEAESFFADRIAPYHDLIAILVAEGKTEEALVMAERASARALLDILAKGKNAKEERPESQQQQQRSAQLQTRLAEANRKVLEESRSDNASPERMEKWRKEQQHARAEFENFRTETALDHGKSYTPPASATIDDMKRVAKDENATLLKFITTKEETFLFVLHGTDSDDAVKVFPLHLTRKQLAEEASAFRALIADRGLDWGDSARSLYQNVLQKSEKAWSDSPRLIIIPDGPLWELPFQTLQRANKHCLLEEHTISYAPSITFLAQLHHSSLTNSRNGPNARVLAIANPALGSLTKKSQRAAPVLIAKTSTLTGEQFEPLPAAEEQAAKLRDLYGSKNCVVLSGEKARENEFKKQAGDYEIVHFATHGVLNDHAPLYSYLLMSQENLSADEDGLLEAWELMPLKLRAHLAVLSACETARGKVSAGEGVIGLSWALFAAGCPSEVVSQWKVDSASNTDLMLEFHRRYRDGASAAEALRAASLALAHNPRYRHPFYWAPFVAIGK